MLFDASTDLSVPAADSVNNNDLRDVAGNKADAAQIVVGATRSLMAYLKGTLNQLATLLGYHGVPGADVVTNTQMRDVIGNKSDAAVTLVGAVASIIAYTKGILNQVATLTGYHAVPGADAVANAQVRDVVGNKADTAQQTVGATMSLMRYLKGLITALGNPTADTLTTITAKLGNSATSIGPQVALQTGNEYVATYSLPNGVAENTAFDFNTQFAGLASKRIKAIAIFLDMVNLTQSCTVRVKVAIDGATLRTISTMGWTVAMDDGVYFDLESCNINFSVTLQSAVAEGVARDVPVRVVFEQMEQ